MKPISNMSAQCQKGFTLLEIIVAITVSAILAVVLVQYFSVSSGRSWKPIQNLQQQLVLQSAMDQITSDYRNLLITSAQPLVTLEQNINAGNYWHESDNINLVTDECIEFVLIGEEWRENPTNDPCVHLEDTLLKVTLSRGNQTLTSIFSR